MGLEIHRQLDTDGKLFCACPARLSVTPPTLTVSRRLRPTQSELGQIDEAALFEFHKGKLTAYEADIDTSCLVELDEEPPHRIDSEALDVALSITLLLKAKPLDEVHVMRKIVIDGSNTTGFQRTIVIGLDGSLGVDGKRVPIEQVTLEEDSARKTAETKTSTVYRLDRLGVPLVEISTGPVIHSPDEAGRTALAIGRVLRSTKKVKRGLGSIRQDLNISIKDGALVEVKGVQELDLVSKAVEFEVKRQLSLLEIKYELKRRGVKQADIKEEFEDVTAEMNGSKSRIVRSSLEKGGRAYAVRLKGFGGLLKRELMPGVRLGTEMSKRAVFYGRVGGIFHSDELPAYGIEAELVDQVRMKVGCEDSDCFALVVEEERSALDALTAVVERAREALERVPEETRAANADGTTYFMRPRPGAARMYPETDVRPVAIGKDRLDGIARSLPRDPAEVAGELQLQYRLSSKLASQLVDSDYLSVFEKIAKVSPEVSPSFVATVLTESLKSLQREGASVENLREQNLLDVFGLAAKGMTAKESVVDILRWLAGHPDLKAAEAVEALGLRMLSKSELESIIDKVVTSNGALLGSDQAKAVGKLMNLVMAEVRGKADPGSVLELLRVRMKSGSS